VSSHLAINLFNSFFVQCTESATGFIAWTLKVVAWIFAPFGSTLEDGIAASQTVKQFAFILDRRRSESL
jgi:hypothetical protein